MTTLPEPSRRRDKSTVAPTPAELARLRRAREDGVSYKDLAARCGVNERTVRKWLTEKRST